MGRAWSVRIVGLVFLALVASPTQADTIRIMPLGDTDTGGNAPYISYRYDLWFLLTEAGFDVDFVGRYPTHSAFDPALYPRFEEFDPDHEGTRAQVLAHMIANASMLIEVNRPHVVLWKASTDICISGDGAAAIMRNQLPDLIDNMRAEDPSLHFVLATAYDWYSNCEPNARDLIPDFNQAIMDTVAAKDTPGSRVVLADHYSGFDITTMFDTQVFHANRQGEMFTAGRWFDALENLLPTIDTGTDGFQINAGLNDAWFDPATAGQGFFITVFPDIEMMFLAWFTFDTERPPGDVQATLGEPGHRWLTAFGPYAGDRAELDIELTSGGVFDAANPVPGSVPDGSVLVDFEDCNAATVSYDILSADVTGMIPIERIALDNVAICQALAE